MHKKRSLFERLTGAINTEDDVFFDDTDGRETDNFDKQDMPTSTDEQWEEQDTEDAELTVDVYQEPDALIIKSIVAGVAPDDLDVSISRDMVSISGTRHTDEESERDDYYHRELYWGSFSRTIVLPEEIDVDEAEATSKNGLLTIRLPKLDKKRKTKLSVKG